MRVHLLAATAVLMLMTGPASAIDMAALDSAAALFDEYAPAEPDIALDQLLGASGFEAAPNPSLIEELAPEIVLRAEADNPGADDFGDDFGSDGSSDAAAPIDAPPVDNAPPAATPVPTAEPVAAGPAQIAPVVPEGWTSYDKLGIGFAAPPDYELKQDEDDAFIVTNSDMKTPKGCAIMGQFDNETDPTKEVPPGADIEKLAERDLGYGVIFTATRISAEDDGIDLKALAVFSKEPFNEDEDYFQFIISCANEPADSARALMDGVLGSLYLTTEPVLPVPESEKPRLGGLVTGALPESWSVYRSNDSEWIIIAPNMLAAANFRLGSDALSALRDLAPDQRSRQFAADPAPTIEHVTMMGAEGWLISGRIAPDDPEHGIYNGGMEGPNTYFFTDRCTPEGDALVVSISAQQSWIDNGNSFDPLFESIVIHWPEGEAVCSDDVAAAMAAATEQNSSAPIPAVTEVLPEPAVSPETPETAIAPAPVAAPSADPAIELAFWDAIKDSTDSADFKAYLDQFPNGVFASLARIRITRLGGGAAQPAVSAPVLATPAPIAAPVSGPSGTFTGSGFGTIRFATGTDGAVVADYTSGNGRIDGRLQGTSLVGRWVQPSSNKRCTDGAYWGELQFEFSADFSSYTGTWSYCDAKLGNPNSKGTRTGDGMPDVSLPVSAATLAPSSTAGTDYAGPHDWQTYVNDRYGTVIDYPADLFSPLPPPDNNDGRRFASSDDQAGFYVFAQYNALEESLEDLFNHDLTANAYEQVTYQKWSAGASGSGWFVVSGYRGPDIFYRRTLLDSDGLLQVFEVRYRRELKDAFDDIVSRMAGSFAAGFGTADAAAGGPASVAGLWAINANGYIGELRLAFGPDGLAGYVTLGKGGRDEILADVRYDPARGQVEFLRPLGALDQHYIGTVTGDQIEGTFNQGADSAYTYKWSATLLEADGFQPENMAATQPLVTVGPITTPGRGSQERKDIMDAARGPVSDDIGQSVIFIVSVLRSDGHWAYLQAKPVEPNGNPILWKQTRFAADWEAGVMSDTVMVLLSKDGGSWHVVDHIVGPTDVYWYSWIDQYQLPEALFNQ